MGLHLRPCCVRPRRRALGETSGTVVVSGTVESTSRLRRVRRVRSLLHEQSTGIEVMYEVARAVISPAPGRDGGDLSEIAFAEVIDVTLLPGDADTQPRLRLIVCRASTRGTAAETIVELPAVANGSAFVPALAAWLRVQLGLPEAVPPTES